MRILSTLCAAALCACTTTGAGPSSPATASSSAPAPSAAPNKPSPLDVKRVNGRLPPEIIQKVVRSNFAPMRKCYEIGLSKNPKLEGKVSTRFVIETDGHVSSAVEIHDAPPPDEMEKLVMPSDTGPRFPDKAVEECVVAKFAALTFPKPEGGIVKVVYPIVFSPGD